jgi:hypothetical protein
MFISYYAKRALNKNGSQVIFTTLAVDLQSYQCPSSRLLKVERGSDFVQTMQDVQGVL